MICDGIRSILIAAGVSLVFVDETDQAERREHAVIYEMEEDEHPCLDGTDDSLVTTEIEVECRAATRGRAKALSRQVKDALQDYTGECGTRQIRAVVQGKETSDIEEPESGRGTTRKIQIVPFRIQHSPA